MSSGSPPAPSATDSSFTWSREIEDWARDLERASVNLVLKQQKIGDTNQAYLFQTALCLHEAAAATRTQGLVADPESIMSALARARSPGGSGTWLGVSLYGLARLVSTSDPDQALSPDGVQEAIERAAIHDSNPTIDLWRTELVEPAATPGPDADPDGTKAHQAPSAATLVDCCLAARRLWLDVAHRDRASACAARLLLAAIFARRGGPRMVFLGTAAGPREMADLLQASRRDSDWMRVFVPLLARSSAKSLAMVNQILAVRRRWMAKLSDCRPTRLRHRSSALDAVFLQPVLSTRNLVELKSRLDGRETSLRHAQTLMTELEAAGAVRSLRGATSQSRLWIAADASLLGI